MKIKIPNSKVPELLVLESVLRFNDEEGYANADHLTDEEVARCRSFGFIMKGEREVLREEIVEKIIPPVEETTMFSGPKAQEAIETKTLPKHNTRKGVRK